MLAQVLNLAAFLVASHRDLFHRMADNSAPPASSSGMAAAGEVANPRACPFRDIRSALGVTASMPSRDIRSAGSDDIRLAGSGVANPTARSPRAIIAPATGAAVDAPRSTMLYRDIRLAGSEGIRVAGSGVANPSASSPPATIVPATGDTIEEVRYHGDSIEEVRYHHHPPNPRSPRTGVFHTFGGKNCLANIFLDCKTASRGGALGGTRRRPRRRKRWRWS